MSLVWLLSFSALVLVVAYVVYGRYVAAKFKLDNANRTPAHTHNDGVDYIPGKVPVVLGHHFASIAGAGPIVGPIIAVAFGWVPAVIWILVGGIFFGAVHDLGSMMASMRHEGKSIGIIIEQYIGKTGKQLFLCFSFATLILIIAVFADIVSKTFVSEPSVASASLFFIILALVFGQTNKIFGHQQKVFVLISVLGVLLMYGFIYLGVLLPLHLSYEVWLVLLMAYAFVASVSPVNILLQPRDYLSSFLLYGLMLMAVAGVLIANPTIVMDTQVHLKTENLGYLFPVLFVTIACGAISGFHSLVASGTTSKQLDKEKDAKTIGFGGMLIESFLAIISIGAVVIMSREDYMSRLSVEGPVTMFAGGLGEIIATTGISGSLAVTFVALTVSAFALTTLDTCTRLARFTFQEYFEGFDGKPGKLLGSNRFIATAIVVLLSVALLASGEFTTLWPVFGSANQLLAAMALLAVAVWLIQKKVNATFVLIPMFFMFSVTLSSLGLVALHNYREGVYLLAAMCSGLFVLAIALIWLARKSLKSAFSKRGKAHV